MNMPRTAAEYFADQLVVGLDSHVDHYLTNARRVFICATPYHIMLAHLLQEKVSAVSGTHAFHDGLILLNSATIPQTQQLIVPERWQSVNTFWIEVNPLFPKRTLRLIDEWLAQFGLVRAEEVAIFTGNDTDWRIQLLISAFPRHRLFLFEDGLGSYVVSRSNAAWKVALRSLIYRFLFGGRYLNSRGLGGSQAETYYALRSGAFPLSPDENRKKLISFAGSHYVNWLRNRFAGALSGHQIERPVLLIISEPLAQAGLITAKNEYAAYHKMAKVLARMEFAAWLCHRHPIETDASYQRKIDAITHASPRGRLVHTAGLFPCLETLLLTNNTIEAVAGFISTGLANAKLLAPNALVLSGGQMQGLVGMARLATHLDILRRFGVKMLE